jgi:hypothetical protein
MVQFIRRVFNRFILFECRVLKKVATGDLNCYLIKSQLAIFFFILRLILKAI